MSRDEQIKKLATEMASAAECAVDDAHLINEYPLLPYATSLVEKDEEIEELKLRRRETVDMCQTLMLANAAKEAEIARLKEKLGIAEGNDKLLEDLQLAASVGYTTIELVLEWLAEDPATMRRIHLRSALSLIRPVLEVAAIREKGTE